MIRNFDVLLDLFVGKLLDYAVVLLDTEGTILSWNAGAEAVKGYRAEDAVGGHVSIFYPPEAKSLGYPERALTVAAAEGRFEESGWRVRKDGSRFWAKVVIIPVNDEEGEILAFGMIAQDITEAKQTADLMSNVTALLESTSRTDYLTGLENRRALESHLTMAISAARRYGRPLVLAMIDIDRFKPFNDEFGRRNGDRYLRNAANAWRRCLRAEDVIARHGGEEFTVVMPDTNLSQSMGVLTRLKEMTPAPLTCSVGAAQWDEGVLGDALMKRAERALGAAKAAGRNRIELIAGGGVHQLNAVVPKGRSADGDEASAALREAKL